MFGRVVFVATLGVAAALLGSFSLLERLPAPAPVAAAPAPAAVAPASDNAAPEQHAARQVFSYREIALRADARGQYAADTLVNGMPVRMLVDTGASDIVISASTAARLGLAPSQRARAHHSDCKRQIDGFARRSQQRQLRRPLYERRRGPDSRARGGRSESARGKLPQASRQRRAARRDADPAAVVGLDQETRTRRVSSKGMS